MTAIVDGIHINADTVWLIIENKKTPLFVATDIAYSFGWRNVDSNHRSYRPILRALNKLNDAGKIGRFHVHQQNVTVFYRLPL